MICANFVLTGAFPPNPRLFRPSVTFPPFVAEGLSYALLRRLAVGGMFEMCRQVFGTEKGSL